MNLPDSHRQTNIMIVIDGLNKDMIFKDYELIKAKNAIEIFIQTVRQHDLLQTIISDHEIQLVNDFGKILYKRLKIEQQLSTVYHPETDEAIERANQILEQYLQYFISFHHDDGLKLLSLAEYTINNQDVSATEMNPFFIEYDYHGSIEAEMNEDIENEYQLGQSARDSISYANCIGDIINHLREFMESVQTGYKKQMNRRRDPISRFAIEDSVGLNLQNIKTIQLYKKLDMKNIKYQIIQVISLHVYHLDISTDIHNVFYVLFLGTVVDNPFSSQIIDDIQSAPVITDDAKEEYRMNEILDFKEQRTYDRREPEKRFYLVKWTGYMQHIGEPEENVKDTAAMDRYIHVHSEKPHSLSENDDLDSGSQFPFWAKSEFVLFQTIFSVVSVGQTYAHAIEEKVISRARGTPCDMVGQLYSCTMLVSHDYAICSGSFAILRSFPLR